MFCLYCILVIVIQLRSLKASRAPPAQRNDDTVHRSADSWRLWYWINLDKSGCYSEQSVNKLELYSWLYYPFF